MSKVLLLYSGGMDSTTLLYYLIEEMLYLEEDVAAVIFNYGQKQFEREFEVTRKESIVHPVDVYVLDLPMDWLQREPALMKGSPVPIPDVLERKQELTVIPGRNAFLLSAAASMAAYNGYDELFFAAVADDFRTYKDCRPAFVSHMSAAFQVAYGIGVHAPFATMTKAEVVEIGLRLEVPYQDTWTCYKGEEEPCLRCDACIERIVAFGYHDRDYYGAPK